MGHEVISTWLGLPADGWPPDHYRLLGLEPREADAEHVEKRVQERLDVVRRYQLSSPEQATEAMNRLAQALICLTDPVARKAYDAQLFGTPLPEPDEDRIAPAPKNPLTELLTPSKAELSVVPTTVEEAAPPSVVSAAPTTEAPAAPVAADAQPAANPATNVVVPDVPRPQPPPADPLVEAAQESPPARRDIGTKRALFRRIVQTRKLLHQWEQAGKYLARPSWKVTRPSEATEMIRQLTGLRKLMREFPPLLGRAGQSGYLVIALAQQQAIVPTYQTLSESQHEALARDWKSGQKLLEAHRDFLRRELRSMRRKGDLAWTMRASRSYVRDHPAVVLLVLGVIALCVAFMNTYFWTGWKS